MELFFSIVVDGLIYASWLFLVAVGLTLIFGVMKILNVAHGALFAIGAYAAATAVDLYFQTDLPAFFSLVAMLASSAVVAVLLGPVVERGILRLFYDRDEVVLLLVTFALLLIFEDLIKIVWGVYSYYVNEPYTFFGNVELGPLYYVGYDFFVVGLSVVVGLVVWFTLNKTATGKVVLAVIHDNEVSRAMGVNVNRIYVATFTIGVFLAAIGGAFTSPMLAITPSMGINPIILSFAVVVIGGLGSIQGAAVGAVLVGLARSATVNLLPELELIVIYAVMALVLFVRPEGLFRQTSARRI